MTAQVSQTQTIEAGANQMSKEELIKECMEKCRKYIEEEMQRKWQMPMQMMG